MYLQVAWLNLVQGNKMDALRPLSLPSRLVIEDDLKPFYEAMRIYETSNVNNVPIITKRKGQYLGGLDTEQYGRGKRAREVCMAFFLFLGLNYSIQSSSYL